MSNVFGVDRWMFNKKCEDCGAYLIHDYSTPKDFKEIEELIERKISKEKRLIYQSYHCSKCMRIYDYKLKKTRMKLMILGECNENIK